MKTISAFTFIHNAIDSGYPIVEAIRAVQPYVDEVVVVDMESTDETREILEKLKEEPFREREEPEYRGFPSVKILNGKWGNQAGETLKAAHSMYAQCSGDVIVHFEADEVYDDLLIQRIISHIHASKLDNCYLAVHRLQIEQNFQRCRWYPRPVHRIWPKKDLVIKDGETTDQHDKCYILGPGNGYLWDITNCFRDNWLFRIAKQAELRSEMQNPLMTDEHVLGNHRFSSDRFNDPHWTWQTTPFNIPDILRPLVGMVKYEPRI